jgi:hypothetical protein
VPVKLVHTADKVAAKRVRRKKDPQKRKGPVFKSLEDAIRQFAGSDALNKIRTEVSNKQWSEMKRGEIVVCFVRDIRCRAGRQVSRCDQS